MMRIRRSIAMAICGAVLAGCGQTDLAESLRKRWPWRDDKDIPVSTPTAESQEGWPRMASAAGAPEPSPAPPAPDEPMPAVAVAPPAPAPAAAAPAAPAGAPARAGGSVITLSSMQVNDKYITADDVLRAARGELIALPNDLSEESFRARAAEPIARALRQIVTDTLVLHEAEKHMNDQLRGMIDREINNNMVTLINEVGGGSKEKLRSILAADGVTLEQLREDNRRRMVVQTYLQSRFMPQITITRRMLLDYYRGHRKDFASDKQVQMQIIAAPIKAFLPKGTVSPTQQQLQAARARAKQVMDRCVAELKAGTPFEAVARRHSRGAMAGEGGLWPMMARKSFQPAEVEKAAFAIQEGQVTMPLNTERGYYIVKARKIKPAVRQTFEQAQIEIGEILRRKQYGTLTEEYFQKLLAKSNLARLSEEEQKARVQFLRRIIDRAVRRYHGKGKGDVWDLPAGGPPASAKRESPRRGRPIPSPGAGGLRRR